MQTMNCSSLLSSIKLDGTTVIKLLMKHSQEYSGFIEGYDVTSVSLVVAVISGVGKALLHGEIPHSALYLSRKCIAAKIILNEVFSVCISEMKMLLWKTSDLLKRIWLTEPALCIMVLGCQIISNMLHTSNEIEMQSMLHSLKNDVKISMIPQVL
jgi:hypothetical protein